MQLSFAAPGASPQGALVLGAQADAVLTPSALRADKASGGLLTRALQSSRFKGKPNEILEIIAPHGLKASRVLLVGLGKGEDLTSARAETLAATIIGRLLTSGERAVTFEIDLPKPASLSAAALCAHLALGVRLRSYAFTTYRRKTLEDFQPSLKTVTIACADAAAAKRSFQALSAIADGVALARDLVNEPPNVLSPPEFARRAKALTKAGLKVTVLGETEMKKLGMNALLGVGKGSEQPSHLVAMEWNGARAKSRAPLLLVGKGVCFDSGGLKILCLHGVNNTREIFEMMTKSFRAQY